MYGKIGDIREILTFIHEFHELTPSYKPNLPYTPPIVYSKTVDLE